MLKKLVLILAYSRIVLSIIYVNLLARNNFLFKSVKGYLVALFALVVNNSFYAILVRNDSNYNVCLPGRL